MKELKDYIVEKVSHELTGIEFISLTAIKGNDTSTHLPLGSVQYSGLEWYSPQIYPDTAPYK